MRVKEELMFILGSALFLSSSNQGQGFDAWDEDGGYEMI